MRQQELINKHQNEPDMLDCQFAARKYYNVAETLGMVAFISAVFSLLFIFLPDFSNPFLNNTMLLLPIILDIISLFSYWGMSKFVSSGALLRNHFDKTVFSLNNNYSDIEMHQIRTLIYKVIHKNPRDYKTQISHTSRDNPPGVKNWYEFSRTFNDDVIIFECQRQNQWWDKKLMTTRLIIYAFIFAAGIACSIIAVINFKIPLIKIIACSMSIVITFADSVRENIRYIALSKKIDDWFEALYVSKTEDQILALQKLIESRRKLRVVEFNMLHKKIAKQLSEEYEQISKQT